MTLARAPGRWHLLRSFGFAFRGIWTLLRTQPNARVHAVIAVAALALAVVLRLPPAEIAVVLVMIAVVLAAEALNTALEALCDLVSPGYHPLVKQAKDVAAASVLLTALCAVLVGLLLFAPRLLALLDQ